MARLRRLILTLPAMDAEALRAQFPVLEEVAYLNSGTDGPLAAPAVESARAELAAQAETGRVHAHFERRFELQDRLRGAYARLVGAPAEEIALTTSTTDGLGRVIAGLGPRARATRSSPPIRSTRACSARCWRRAGAASRSARSRSRTCPRRSARTRRSSRSRT